jgi:hypothetical protein
MNINIKINISTKDNLLLVIHAVENLDDQDSIPGRDTNGIFSLHCRVQTNSGAHSTFHPVDTRGSHPRGKVAGE